MRIPWHLIAALGLVWSSGVPAADGLARWREKNPVWRGAHVIVQSDASARALEQALPALQRAGLNVLIVEVNYAFAYDSRPDLRHESTVSKAQAASLAARGRDLGIRVIPQFSSLGHQSWAKSTFTLLRRHPEFDETPGKFPDNEGIYCRSWCPQHPGVLPVVLPLFDELINAFQADAFHVGMDEVFLIASEHCERCRGGNPAELFARAVRDLHDHLVGRRGVEMLLWADRLLDAELTGYGEWEAAKNGTAPAVDLIPKDIILCDWHYELPERYPGKPKEYVSVPYLLGKGFRVWPAGWKDPAAVKAFMTSAAKHRQERLLGYLVTTWHAVPPSALPEWPPLQAGFEAVRDWDR